jgi:hypothetical protein
MLWRLSTATATACATSLVYNALVTETWRAS